MSKVYDDQEERWLSLISDKKFEKCNIQYVMSMGQRKKPLGSRWEWYPSSNFFCLGWTDRTLVELAQLITCHSLDSENDFYSSG